MSSEIAGHVLAILNLAATIVITILVYQFTKRSQLAATTSTAKEMINQFDLAMLENEENARAISELRPPAPGFTKRQEHLMFLYLNHLEYTLHAHMAGLVSEETLNQYCEDCLSYYREHPEALSHQLGCGYPDHFVYLVVERYRELYGHQLPEEAVVHPTRRLKRVVSVTDSALGAR